MCVYVGMYVIYVYVCIKDNLYIHTYMYAGKTRNGQRKHMATSNAIVLATSGLTSSEANIGYKGLAWRHSRAYSVFLQL